MKRYPALLLALLASACSSDPVPVDGSAVKPSAEARAANIVIADDGRPVPPLNQPALAVEGEGLRLFDRESGAARPIAFGTARDAVMAALAFRDPPDTGRQEECGAGPLDYAAWPDGLKLYFQQGKFAGWALDRRASGALSTASGIGPGSSRAELEAAYAVKVAQSTLGTEFTAGALSGLLDGPARDGSVSNMWAGTSCNFR